MGYKHEAAASGACITVQKAARKLEGFREWYDERSEEEAAHIDYLRERFGMNTIWQLGPNGIDELICSLLLKEMELKHAGKK